jgi:hypothetical protein
MISSLEADQGNHYITESLRITELSLKHFFCDTETRLVIGRICDIAENRGGIVSTIEKQIREKLPIEAFSPEGKTYMISSHSAANFILQSLVEARKRTSGEVVFVCDAGEPVSLAEVAKKIANYYGLEFGKKPGIQEDHGRSRTVHLFEMKSPRLEATFHKNIKVLKEDENLQTRNIQIALKNFVVGNNSELSAEDWKNKTRLILDLCGPHIFGGQ